MKGVELSHGLVPGCLTRAALLLAALIPWPARAQLSGVRRSPEARVNEVFSEYARADVPGCAVAVMVSGRVEYAHGYGMADLEAGIPITPVTPFYAASTSKQFTAAVVLLLAREGRLSLDDPVRRYVPEVPEVAAEVTIRQLLHHTSGLRDYFGLLALRQWRFDDTLSVRGFHDLVAAQRALNFIPGTRHLYSNTGYVLLSQVAERAGGATLRTLAARRLFAPLHMEHSRFRDDHTEPVEGAAVGYEPSGAMFRRAMPTFDVVGDGGLFTTVLDLARWEANFNAPQRALREVTAQLGERGVLSSGDTIPYAMGLQYGTYRGQPTLAHGGAYAGYRADFTRFPRQGLAVAVLCNRADANPAALSRQVAEIYAERAFREPRPGEPPPDATLARPEWEGAFWNEETETLARVTIAAGRLLVTLGGTSVALSRGRGDSLVAPASGARYLLSSDTLRVRRPLWPTETYVRADSAPLPPAERGGLAGRYVSDELATSLTVALRDTTLLVRLGGTAGSPLTPLFGRTFLGTGGLVVRFAADGQTITISNGRTQRVAFRRAR